MNDKTENKPVTVGEAASSVGAWESDGNVCFGSWQAVRAFAMKMQRNLAKQPEGHPFDCLHINQGSMDAAADQYEAEYRAAHPSIEAPALAHDDALQALADQAQELDMGYGPNACPTCGKSQPVVQPAPMPAALPTSMLEFDAFLNEPPDYEELRMVREYRHAAYPKWEKVVADIRKALAALPLPAQQVVAVSPDVLKPIPKGVYYVRTVDNFYDAADGRGMGDYFHAKWRDRRAEFPQSRDAAIQSAKEGQDK